MAAPKGNKYNADGAGGRPTKYEPSFNKRVFKLALLGLTDSEIAELLGVSDSTFDNWKLEHEEFLGSLNKGKTEADANVAASLYKRAKGYKQKTEKIFQFQGQAVKVPYTEIIAPDVGAAKLWLSNRQRTKWRESIDVTTNGKDLNSSDWISKLPLEKQVEIIQLMNESNSETEG